MQRTLEELMEQIVFLLQYVDRRGKQLSVNVAIRKELKECMHAVLRNITMVMIPSAYFKSIINLLRNADGNVRKKVCCLLNSFCNLTSVYKKCLCFFTGECLKHQVLVGECLANQFLLPFSCTDCYCF